MIGAAIYNLGGSLKLLVKKRRNFAAPLTAVSGAARPAIEPGCCRVPARR